MSPHHTLRPSRLRSELLRSIRPTLLAPTPMSMMGAAARAGDGYANDLLLKKMEKMEQRIQSLEAELKQKQAPASAAAAPSATAANQPPAAASPKNANAAVPAAQSVDSSKVSETASVKPSTLAPEKPILGLIDSRAPGLTIGAYGEIKFGSQQNPAANGQWQK